MDEFVPLTDDYLERHPEVYERLVPYNWDYPCRRQAVNPMTETNVREDMLKTGEHHE